MKTLAAIFALSLLIIGCECIQTRQDSFESLHGLIEQTLADSCDCGPILTNVVVGGRYFEVNPRPRGLTITVLERQFLTPNEWHRRYTSGTNLIPQFMDMLKTNPPIPPVDTNHPIDMKMAEHFIRFTNLFGLFDLPGWNYQNISVDVRVQELDVAYPGDEKDDAEAQKHYNKIIRLLKPYH